jgi:hypothetical protein
MYGHGEMVIMANWVVEVLMAARLVCFSFRKIRVSVSEVVVLKTKMLDFTVMINQAFVKLRIIQDVP